MKQNPQLLGWTWQQKRKGTPAPTDPNSGVGKRMAATEEPASTVEVLPACLQKLNARSTAHLALGLAWCSQCSLHPGPCNQQHHAIKPHMNLFSDVVGAPDKGGSCIHCESEHMSSREAEMPHWETSRCSLAIQDVLVM